MLAFSQRTSLSASGMLLHVVLHQKLILLVCRFQVNSSNGKWCVTRIPLNGALSHPDVGQASDRCDRADVSTEMIMTRGMLVCSSACACNAKLSPVSPRQHV